MEDSLRPGGETSPVSHTGTDGYRIASVHRALQILLAFKIPPNNHSLAQLTKLTGTSKNACFRSLRTLQELGFVELDSTSQTYRLGLVLWELAHAANRGWPLATAAEDMMDNLSSTSGEVVNLIVRDGYGVTCVAQKQSRHRVQITAEVGKRFPALHAGSCPKAILAHSSEEFIETYLDSDQLVRLTPKTRVERDVLLAHLYKIRQRGFSISDEDVDLGIWSVAAPIFDRNGECIAAISIDGPSHRMGREQLDAYIPLVMDAATTISRRLGYLQGSKVGVSDQRT